LWLLVQLRKGELKFGMQFLQVQADHGPHLSLVQVLPHPLDGIDGRFTAIWSAR
jgi:hypothetical protein